jgi:hypothetical protein
MTSNTVVLVPKNAPPVNFAPTANAYSIAPPDKPLAPALVSIPTVTPITADLVVSNALAVKNVPVALVLVPLVSPIALVSVSIPKPI